jgi:hypothetical protein
MNTIDRLKSLITKPEQPSLETLATAERARREQAGDRRDLRRALKRIDELEADASVHARFATTPIAPVEHAVLSEGRRPAAAVALLSDVHAEEGVIATPAIHNSYSIEIARQRVARFFAGLQWLIAHAQAHAFDIGTLVLWLGGDLISGDIHEELLETCSMRPIDAALMVRDWIIAGVQQLLVELPGIQLIVPCSCGNHARTTKRVRPSTGAGHNLESVIYENVAREFAANDRVQICITPDEMQYVEVLGYTLAFHHGHRMRYSGGIGGITIPAIKAMHRWQQWRECDYYHFGHFHTRIDLGQIAFNGSVIGPNPYALSIGAAPERPQQSFYVLDAKRGKTMCCPIWVEE